MTTLPAWKRDGTVRSFWARVDRSGGPEACWPYMGTRDRLGYGRAWNGERPEAAHRIAWRLAYGPIPGDRPVIRHTCDNRPCCNPSHLTPGTQADNMADMRAKGRGPTADRHGTRTHPESVPRGERNGNAKVTAEQVREIRAMYARGTTQRAIADVFGVKEPTIQSIVTYKSWRHVEEA